MKQSTILEVDTRIVTDEGRPWLSLRPYAELVSIKLLSTDPVRGEIIVVLRAPPGIELPRHRTTGSMTVYTMQGRWKYRERDWVAGPGSLVIAPADSCLTPCVLGEGADDAIMLVLASGDVQCLDDAGHVLGVENWRTATDRHLEHCEAHGLDPGTVLPPSAPLTVGRPQAGCRSI